MWTEAFLIQAKADWEMYAKLEKAKEPVCHVLHYLQMATEKLGKAYFLASGAEIDGLQTSHRAFTKFLRIIALNSYLQEALGMTAAQLRVHVRQLLPLAHAVETLAPALAAGGINAEYPWMIQNGAVVAPINYTFSINDTLRAKRGRDLLKLIAVALDNFLVLHKISRKGA